MPITVLDAHAALVVIDMQKGVVSIPAAHPMDDVIANVRLLADGFRRRGAPVVLVNVVGGAPGRVEQSPAGTRPADWIELIPELNQQPSDHRVTKRTWGAFTGTDLESLVRKLGVTQIVLAGVATSMGVESTARHAHELGFNVALAVDAMTDRNADAHLNSVTRIFPRLGETGSTRDIIRMLERA